jgi:hypothetical protein
VVLNSYGQVTSATAGTTYTLPSPAPTAGDYTAPSAVSVNSAGQITSITSGTAYSLPSPAPASGDYASPSSISVNSAGQITSITAGTAYNVKFADGVVASTSPYTIRWTFSNSYLTASAYQIYIYQVGGSQYLYLGGQSQYGTITTPTITGGQTAFAVVTRENLSFPVNGVQYTAWGYSFGTTISYPETNVSFSSQINVQNGYDWYLNFYMVFNNAFTPAPSLSQRIMLVPVI